MNVEIEFENYNIKSPKMPDPFNVNLINAVGSGGGGGGNEVELTWAEYEALSEAEKMNGTNYFITDINTTKSLTSKVLLAPSTISANTDYALTDSYKNYDYVVVEVVNSEFKYVRASKMLNIQNGETGGIIDFYQSSSWYGAVEVTFTSDTVFRTNALSQSNNAYTDSGSSKIRITGYIYQRVVVPNQMINYSTVEAKIGTWIDGKPLYQKTIHIGALTKDTNWHEIPHGISNFKKLVDIKGVCDNNDTVTRQYPINVYRPDMTSGINFSATTSSIFYMNNFTTIIDCYVTLIYTKTTD